MPKLLSTQVLSSATAALAIAAAAVATLARPLATDPTTRPDWNTQHGQALDLFRRGHHAAAYGRLVRLADAGHAGAAHLALLLTTQGKAMVGLELSATAAQQLRWNALVVNQGLQFVPAADTSSGE
jgi:hypothetical protein